MNPDFPTKKQIADGYDSIASGKFMPKKFHARCVSLMRPYLKSGYVVGDFGCGKGSLLEALNDLPFKLKLSGCDLSPMLVNNAKQRVPDADVRVADIESLPFEQASFDAVFATEVMEHLASPVAGLVEIHRVLKPGSWLLVSLPNRDWFRFEKYLGERKIFQPVDDHFYRVSEFENFLIQAGFSVEKIRGGENLYFGGGLPRLLEKAALVLYPRLQRRMKRMIFLARKPK